MGSLLDFCSPQEGDQFLTLVLLKAIKRTTISISQVEEKDINKYIMLRSNNPTQQLQLSHCKILFQQKSATTTQQNAPMLPMGEARLIVRQSDDPKRGLIVYQGGYFVGRLSGNRANEEGEMYLVEQMQSKAEEQTVKLIVQGKWSNDILVEGQAFDRNKKFLFSMRWVKEMREINVKFAEGDIQQYTGHGQFCKARTLQQMLTGEGKVVFRNRSIYTGKIMNGLFDTSDSDKEGVFVAAQEKYRGHYVSGRRHGKSTIEEKIEGSLLIYQLTWNMGVPDLSTMVLLSNDPRATLVRLRV